MQFTELLGTWMKDKQAYRLKRRTYLRYEEIIRTQISPSIGKLDTGELTVPILQSFQRQKLTDGNIVTGKALASNTVKNMMSIVRNAIDYGRELGVPVCDTRQVVPLKFEEKQITAFRKDEQKRIEKAVAESKKPNHFGIILCLYTGLRLGELLALTWNDIDFHTGVLTVNKTSCVLKEDGAYKIHVDRPKTDSSVRVIPIPKPILAELKTMRKKSRAEFVISTCRGGRVSNRSYQTTYAKILTRARVDYKNFHVLRHTFATRALECGTDIKTLSELMGHKSPVITMNRYVHSLMETKRKAMVRLKTKEEAQRFASKLDLDSMLREALVSSASLVESVREEIPSARACVILSDSEREHSEILREYRLTDAFPEDSEDFEVGGAIWRRQTYILDDAGDGIFCFYPLPPR